MNVLLLAPEEVEGDRAQVRGRRAEHVAKVLGKGQGDALVVGMIGGRLGRAEIVGCDGEVLELRCEFDRDPPPPLMVELVLALPRPPVLRRTLQQAAAMGVKRIVLCHSARVEKSYWGTPSLAPAQVREQLILGLEQGVDTVLPVVEARRAFRPFVEDELACHPSVRRWFADPSGAGSCPCDVVEPSVLLVGPEGGWVSFERELLESAGFSALGLGPRILRVETAVVALLARLGLGSR